MSIGQYEKLAIVAFRFVGICFVVMGLIWGTYALLFLLPGSYSSFVSYFVPTLLYVIMGFLLFVLSTSLAALTIRNLKDE